MQIAPVMLSTLPDAELTLLASHGDAGAFEIIMRRYNRSLFRTARAILKNDAEAEDALQEAYLRAWRGLAGFRAEARLSTWLIRIVANEALGRLRRNTAEIIPLDAVPGTLNGDLDMSHEAPNDQPELAAMRVQLRKMLEARIDLLPDAFRMVFVLRAVEEMTVNEVAVALDIPEATVRSRFFRAKSLLRESFANDLDILLGDAFGFDGARCDRIVASVIAKAQVEGLAVGLKQT